MATSFFSTRPVSMIFFKRKKSNPSEPSSSSDASIMPTPEATAATSEALAPPAPTEKPPETPPAPTGFFARLKQGLTDITGDTKAADTRPEVIASANEKVITPANEIATPPAAPRAAAAEIPAPVEEPPAPSGFFARIKQGLTRTSNQFAEGIGNLFLGKKTIDDELLEDIETQLLVADVGIDATNTIINDLTARVARKQLNDADALYAALQDNLRNLLLPVEQPLVIDKTRKPFVILVIGVNGAGKTTTIGKLAHRLQKEGKSVMLAAGDTFRAAAVEQLQAWGERNKVTVIAQHTGADSASVIFDALNAARARNIDVLIADTAGRLHNKSHLMEELVKVKRVLAKIDDSAPHETLLVLDAGTGQNAVNQCDQFHESLGVTGLALTKLDGTAKGGIIFALSQKHRIPIRFIGVGETLEDLQPFAAKPFVEALFGQQP